jgi:hypothetical protein
LLLESSLRLKVFTGGNLCPFNSMVRKGRGARKEPPEKWLLVSTRGGWHWGCGQDDISPS